MQHAWVSSLMNSNQHVNTSERKSAFSAILAKSTLGIVSAVLRLRQSIKRGCRAFLALVTETEIADAALAAASKN